MYGNNGANANDIHDALVEYAYNPNAGAGAPLKNGFLGCIDFVSSSYYSLTTTAEHPHQTVVIVNADTLGLAVKVSDDNTSCGVSANAISENAVSENEAEEISSEDIDIEEIVSE